MVTLKYLAKLKWLTLFCGMLGIAVFSTTRARSIFVHSNSKANDQYKSVSKVVHACKSPKNDIELSINTKIQFENQTSDKLVVYSLGKKRIPSYFAYKSLEDININKYFYDFVVSRFTFFELNKPVSEMEAKELFSEFTLLGPGGKYEDTVDYSLEIPASKIQNIAKNDFYIIVHFEALIPDEIEEMLKEKLKFLSPKIIKSITPEPILIKASDVGNLSTCN